MKPIGGTLAIQNLIESSVYLYISEYQALFVLDYLNIIILHFTVDF